jgi:hypothetical protein
MVARLLLCVLLVNISRAQTIECSSALATPSCRSFAELLRARDKELISSIGPESTLVACFRKSSDVFVTVSFPTDKALVYAEEANHMRKAAALVEYDRYKDGVSEDEQVYIGNYTRYSYPGMTPSFRSEVDEKDKTRGASITDSEISIYYTYDNAVGGKTTYSMQIRRSTMRFVETFRSGDTQTNETGYCKQF